MAKEYTIRADRNTIDDGYVWFRCEAESEEEALELASNGEAEEIDWFVGKTNEEDSEFKIVSTYYNEKN